MRPLSLRDAYFLPDHEHAIEFRAFTHGLLPRTVPAMMQHFVEDWRVRGVDAWNQIPNHWRPDTDEAVGWWTLPTYLGDHFIAPLLGAPAGTCIHQPNVHWVVQSLLSSPEILQSGQDVLLTEAEFPSVLHSVRQWQKILGFTMKVLPPGSDGFVDQQSVLDAITPQTGLVLLSHVGFTTGEKLPDTFLAEVAARTHAHGGLFALDGYHATGSIPVQVDNLGADVYFGGLLKEASGSSGNAYIYIRPGVTLTPRTTGWFGDADPFGFQTSPAPHPDVRLRFMGGTSAVASMYHAVEGVRLLLEVGLSAVRAHSLALTEIAIERAEESGFRLQSPREAARRSAMVILQVPEADRLCVALKQKHIYTDSRKGRYLRLAPFVWNTAEEVERAFDVIADLMREGTYRDLPDPNKTQTGPVT